MVQISRSVMLTLCDPMDCSTPGSAVRHQLLELTQTHVHWVSDAIQPSHPLSSPFLLPSIFPSIRDFPVRQFFTSGGQSIGASASASVLPKNIQDWFPLGWTGWISLQSKELSRVFSNTTVQKHQFFCTQFSLYYSDAGRDWGQEEKGTTEDEMAGWHHWLDGCESQWTPGVVDGQGGLACCDSWGRKCRTQLSDWTELSDTTEYLC